MNITAKAENGRAVISIKGQIAGWRDSEKNFTATVDSLIESGVKDAHLYINSPGGDCFEANEIVNVMKRFPGTVTGEGGALVASAATYIAIHCQSFTMPENGLFMIHQPSGIASGRKAEIKTYLDLLDKISQTYYDAYMARTTMPEKEFKEKWDAGDFWMNAKEAKEYGFATSIGGKTDITEDTASMIAKAGYNGPVSLTVAKQINNPKNPKKEMELNALLVQFGLSASMSEGQFIETISEWKRKAERVEMLEKKEEDRQNAEIEALLNQAILDRRITADVKEDWREMLVSNFESGKKMLAAMSPVKKPVVVKPLGNNSGADMKWEDIMNDPSACEKLMKEDPETYDRIFNEWVTKNRK